MPAPRFTKHVIATLDNDLPPAPMNTFHAVGDIDGDGRLDVAISGHRLDPLRLAGRRGVAPILAARAQAKEVDRNVPGQRSENRQVYGRQVVGGEDGEPLRL